MIMKQYISFFLLIFYVFVANNITAATYIGETYNERTVTFAEITEENGLISNKATCIYKDYKGFIWIGTENGLNRYDGKQIKSYTYLPADTNSISNNVINCIKEDANNNLLIGTSNGLNLFNRKNKKFTRFFADSSKESTICHNKINKFLKDKENNFWIATERGINKAKIVDENTFQFNTYKPDFKRVKTRISDIKQDQQGRIWVSSWGEGLFQFDPVTGEFRSLFYDSLNPLNNINDITCIEILNQDDIWIGTYNQGLIIYYPETENLVNPHNNLVLKKHLNSTVWIEDLYKDRNGLIWISALSNTMASLYSYDYQRNEVIFRRSQRTIDTRTNEIISKGAVRDIYQDNNNILWFANTLAGIEKFDPNQNKFSKYYIELKGENQFRDYIKDIEEDNDERIWLATFGDGLIHCDKRSGKIIKRYFFDDRSPRGNLINSVCKDNNGKLWVGSVDGLYKFNPLNGNIEKVYRNHVDKLSIKHKTINEIINDPFGMLTVLTQEGIDRINPDDGEIITNKIFEEIKIGKITYINYDKSGNLLVCGSEGFAFVDIRDNKIKYLEHSTRKENSLMSEQITCALEGDKKRYWISTANGLSMFDSKNKTFKNYTKKDGLATNNILRIIQTDNGIWMRTNKGLSFLNIHDASIKNYSIDDGLRYTYYGYCIWKDSKNYIYVADEHAYTKFLPGNIKENNIIPPVYFTGMKINGYEVSIGEESVLNNALNYTRKITLKPYHKQLYFSFAALNYTLPEKNLYKYKLQGYDTAWHRLGHRNELFLMNLPSGDYILNVMGANNDAVWNPVPATLSITMLPVWWKTWWAILIYISLTGALLIVFFYFRISRLKHHKNLELEKEKAKLQHENDEVKLKFFTNISHEFRTPITLIRGPLETILNTINPDQKVDAIKQQLKLIYKNASRLNVLVERVLEFRKIQTGHIKNNWSKEDIVHYIKDVYENFKGLAEHKKINYSFHSFHSNFYAWIDIKKLQHVLFNLISNAFKFTPDAGSIEISFDTDDYTVENNESKKYLKIKVSDSGIGIPENEIRSIFSRFHRANNQEAGITKTQGTGIGLELSKEYVELMKGNILVDSQQGKGTEFKIIIPYYTDEEINELITNKSNKNSFMENEDSDIITDELSYDPGLITETKQETGSENSVSLSVIQEKEGFPAMLIVEDNRELLNFLKANYSKNYNIIEAVNGQHGIDAALNNVPDIIISDIMMPEIDGIELCRQLKANKITSHIPIILLTAKSLVEHQIKGYEIGADDYITKPFDINILNTRIINLLENRKRMQRFFLSDMFNDLQHIPQISSADKIFLTEIEEIVGNSYMNEDFSVEGFAEQMKISRSQLHRKFMGFLGISPSSYIKKYRLNKAAEMLKFTSNPNIAEVSFKCGFKHPSHFTRSFRNLFKISPTEYIKQ